MSKLLGVIKSKSRHHGPRAPQVDPYAFAKVFPPLEKRIYDENLKLLLMDG